MVCGDSVDCADEMRSGDAAGRACPPPAPPSGGASAACGAAQWARQTRDRCRGARPVPSPCRLSRSCAAPALTRVQ